jgi:hypothetical protein
MVNRKPKYVRVTSEPARQTASLKNLVKGKEVGASNAFPDRKETPAPSSQASSRPLKQVIRRGSSLKTIVTKETHSSNNAFPQRKEAPAPSSQAPAPASTKEVQKGPSLKTIITKEPLTSNNAFPERKTAPPPSSQAPSHPKKQPASGDHVSEGLTLRRYTQTRKASTPLGGLANPSSTESPRNDVSSFSEKSVSPERPTVKTANHAPSSFANLSNLVGNGKNSINRDRSTVNQARTTSTKLGDMANPSNVEVEPPTKITVSTTMPATKNTETESIESKDPKIEVKRIGDRQEAFQRELLSSRLAYEKAKPSGPQKKQSSETVSVPPASFSNLSAILQRRDKRSITPTINRDRASVSLFPEKSKLLSTT